LSSIIEKNLKNYFAQRPAVKDVLQARISKLRSSLQGLQNVAEQKRAEGEARTRFCVA